MANGSPTLVSDCPRPYSSVVKFSRPVHPMSIRPGTYWLPYGKGLTTVCVDDETEQTGDLKKFLTREGNIEYPSEYGSYWHTFTIAELVPHTHNYNEGTMTSISGVGANNQNPEDYTNTGTVGETKAFSIVAPSITVFTWQRCSLWDYNNDKAYMLNPFHVKLEEYNIYGNIWSAPLPDGTLPPTQVSQDGNPFF